MAKPLRSLLVPDTCGAGVEGDATRTERGILQKLTNHVSARVLTTTLLRNIACNSQVDYHIVIGRVVLGFEATDDGEATALVQLFGNLLKLRTEGRQGKGVLCH